MKRTGSAGQRARSALTWVIQLGLGCALVWSSVHKIRQPYDFLSSVYGYQLVGADLGVFTAIALPWVELAIGLCLVCGLFVGGALLGSALLLVVFGVVQASVLWRGLSISCACFSTSGSSPVNYATLVRTVVLGVLAGAAFLSLCLRSSKEGEHGPGQAV